MDGIIVGCGRDIYVLIKDNDIDKGVVIENPATAAARELAKQIESFENDTADYLFTDIKEFLISLSIEWHKTKSEWLLKMKNERYKFKAELNNYKIKELYIRLTKFNIIKYIHILN